MGKRNIRYILVFLMLVFCIGNATALTETIQFSASVPEDHGVVFPEDALRMDHILFSIDGVLVEKDGNADVIFDGIHSYVAVDIIFYGNLSTDYEVTLAADSDSGWISKEDPDDYIPINVYFNEFYGEDGIHSEVNDSYDAVDISVPVSGPRRGQKVAEMIISWESGLELQPGYYDMDLNLSLWSR